MSKCIKQNTMKYKSRSSPPYSAMDCQGKVMIGNDGATYISKPDKRGIYRWVKSSDIVSSKILKNKTMRIKPKLKLKLKLNPKSSIKRSVVRFHRQCRCFVFFAFAFITIILFNDIFVYVKLTNRGIFFII